MKNGSIMVLLTLLIFSGCANFAPKTRTVYVPEGDAIMLRQKVKGVDVWAKPSGEPVPGTMDLWEGWF